MEIKIWDLKNYKADHCLFFKQAIECGNWAFASDYARADLLRRYGGVYMDLDVEMLRPIDDLLYNDAYMSFESLDRIECGSGMGAGPEHPILQKICESYENRPYLKNNGSWIPGRARDAVTDRYQNIQSFLASKGILPEI